MILTGCNRGICGVGERHASKILRCRTSPMTENRLFLQNERWLSGCVCGGMARPPRILYNGAVYHVMARGNRRQKIFFDDTDRLIFLEKLGEACQRYHLKC